MDAQTVAEAQDEFRKLLVERSENRLRHIGQCPRFGEYLEQTYRRRLATSGKKPDTLVTEAGHLGRWCETIGHLHLDKVRPHHITAHLQKLKENGKANRTCNLALVMLRNLLKSARVDGFIKMLPVEGIQWQRTETKARKLFTREDIEVFCQAGLAASKNGTEFADYIRLLALCGAREQETIRLRWADVDFEHKLLTIGADADTKNREARRVDFNAELETHLKAMHSRRAPDSQWLFPSPQRGDRDERAKTFRESLLLTRATAGWSCLDCGKLTFGKETPKVCPQCQGTRLEAKAPALPEHLHRFGFHDCRLQRHTCTPRLFRVDSLRHWRNFFWHGIRGTADVHAPDDGVDGTMPNMRRCRWRWQPGRTRASSSRTAADCASSAGPAVAGANAAGCGSSTIGGSANP